MYSSDHTIQAIIERKGNTRANSEMALKAIEQSYPANFHAELLTKLRAIADENASLKSKLRKIQLLTSSTRKFVENIVPCRKGCSACCHMPVEITKSEAELIGNAISRKPEHLSPGHHKLASSLHSRPDTPCPFLINNACSIYENRPIVCRNHTVLDVDNLSCSFENMSLQATKDSNAADTPRLSDAIIPAYMNLVESQDKTIADIRHFFPNS